VPVVVARAETADLPVQVQTLGTVESIQPVSVRSQVGGTLMDIHFREGDLVRKGQLLFRIDPLPLEAALRQAEANLARDEAQVRSLEAQARHAKAQVVRYRELVDKDYVTQEQYEQVRTDAEAMEAGLAAARATVGASKATVENARLQLGYTEIHAPTSGQTGGLQVRVGDLVKAVDASPLVVINPTQPILVTFSVPEANLAEIQKYRKEATLRVRVTLPGFPGEGREGALVFVDNAVDPSTGTILLKAQFENGDSALWPGQFVDVALILHVLKDAVVVPSEAIQTGQQGTYVFLMTPNGTVAIQPVTAGIAFGGRTVIREGIQPGATVVTDGQLRLTPGAAVEVKRGGGAPGQATR
jgi:multidrug efflux system membrane fusion protein